MSPAAAADYGLVGRVARAHGRPRLAASSSSSCSYPELARCLIDRAIQRSKYLAVNMAIVHQARVDVRLHMLLWHLAARWGRVRSDGTVLRLRLTHTVLADLVAARRPTVTTALSELARRGLVRTDGETWVLPGEAPADLLAFAREAPSDHRVESPASPGLI